MTVKGKALALAVSALAMSSAAFAMPPTPSMISNACAGCHGTNGASAGLSMPVLAGQDKDVIVESMKEFKSGKRPSTIMGRLAKGYGDADFKAMGEFFSKQKPYRAAQTLDPAKVARGEELHQKACKRCHLENGKEGEDGSAVLAGQWLKYLQIQADDYMSGKRKMSDKMADKVKPLSKEDMDALAHFYASVK